MNMALIIHGGACEIEKARRDPTRRGIQKALTIGHKLLRSGASAVLTVERVVAALEDDPVFVAGRGSYRNAAGIVEMDAIIVDGATLKFGAVAAIRNVANPVCVAKRVMENTSHCLLAGDGAKNLLLQKDFGLSPTMKSRLHQLL